MRQKESTKRSERSRQLSLVGLPRTMSRVAGRAEERREVIEALARLLAEAAGAHAHARSEEAADDGA